MSVTEPNVRKPLTGPPPPAGAAPRTGLLAAHRGGRGCRRAREHEAPAHIEARHQRRDRIRRTREVETDVVGTRAQQGGEDHVGVGASATGVGGCESEVGEVVPAEYIEQPDLGGSAESCGEYDFHAGLTQLRDRLAGARAGAAATSPWSTNRGVRFRDVRGRAGRRSPRRDRARGSYRGHPGRRRPIRLRRPSRGARARGVDALAVHTGPERRTTRGSRRPRNSSVTATRWS